MPTLSRPEGELAFASDRTNSFQSLEALEAALQEHQQALAVRKKASDGVHLADWKVLLCETNLWVEFREDPNLRNEFWKRHASAVKSHGPRAELLSFLKAIHPRLTESQRTHRADAVEHLVGIDPSGRLQVIKNAGGVRGVARLRKLYKPSRGRGTVPTSSSDDGGVTRYARNEASASVVPGRDPLEAHVDELLSADPTEWATVPRLKLKKLWAILSKHFGLSQAPERFLRRTDPRKGMFDQPVKQ